MATKTITPEEAVRLWYAANPGDATTMPMMPSLYAQDFANLVLARYGGISEAEARERERTAVLWAVALGSDGREHMGWIYLRKEPDVLDAINERYPSLLPPEPPTITLSTGYTYRRRAGKWEVKNDSMASVFSAAHCQTPLCDTPEDHRKCASLMEAEAEK